MSVNWSKVWKIGSLGLVWLWEKWAKKRLPEKVKKMLGTPEAQDIIAAVAKHHVKQEVAAVVEHVNAMTDRIRATIDKHSQTLAEQAQRAREQGRRP